MNIELIITFNNNITFILTSDYLLLFLIACDHYNKTYAIYIIYVIHNFNYLWLLKIIDNYFTIISNYLWLLIIIDNYWWLLWLFLIVKDNYLWLSWLFVIIYDYLWLFMIILFYYVNVVCVGADIGQLQKYLRNI